LEDLGLDWRILLKWIFKKWDGKAWTGLMGLRTRTGAGGCACGNVLLGFVKYKKFHD
jgi:hypothetical protein